MESSLLPNIWGVIPARYQSTRFPGKLLKPLLQKPLLYHTWLNAKKVSLFQEVWIATDDDRIFNEAKFWKANVKMTGIHHRTGTDRIAEMIQSVPKSLRPEIVVNVQGDEPLIDPQGIEQVVLALVENKEATVSTAVCHLEDLEKLKNPSIVKCVFNEKKEALYFSRSPLPALHPSHQEEKVSYYHHIGIYAFRTDFLLAYPSLAPSPLEKAEGLEQLRILEHGHRISVAIIPQQPYGVDNPEDLTYIENLLCQKNISSSQAESALL